MQHSFTKRRRSWAHVEVRQVEDGYGMFMDGARVYDGTPVTVRFTSGGDRWLLGRVSLVVSRYEPFRSPGKLVQVASVRFQSVDDDTSVVLSASRRVRRVW